MTTILRVIIPMHMLWSQKIPWNDSRTLVSYLSFWTNLLISIDNDFLQDINDSDPNSVKLHSIDSREIDKKLRIPSILKLNQDM